MKFLIILLIPLLFLNSCSEEKTRDLTGYVNPMIGTGGHGHTYPGVCMPFGMMQISPDTRLEGWDGCSGYHYSDSVIYGFSHTHLSGTGCSDYGDILLMPTTGAVRCFNGYPDKIKDGYASYFSHKNEKSSPGYYSVILDNYNIKAELTATQRAAIHKYTYPENTQKNIILDLAHRDEVIESSIRITGSNTVEGFRRSKAWATDQVVYFYLEFSESIIQSGIFMNDTLQSSKTVTGKNLISYFSFNPNSDLPLTVRIGISQTGIDGAMLNLGKEIPSNDFEKYVKQAQETWNKKLGKVDAYGDSTTLINFYTALYHSYLAPNLASDVDGRYLGMDKKTHSAKHNYYTVFSLWDTYRALHPLMSILEPEESNNFVKTFLLMYKEGGLLPVWELSSSETYCMIGYHAVSVIFDLYQKDLRDYDTKLAFEAMKKSAMQDHYGLSSLKKNGFITADEDGESVSKTLEYAYNDWCISLMAKTMNKTDDFNYFNTRAQSWKQIYDNTTGFMRARMNGSWFSPFTPYEVNNNYTEANAWQYSFYVPQDIRGLMDIMGGETAFENKLDSMFNAATQTSGREQADITGLIGQYAHGNEPSHHMAYLYNYVGKPHKTQEIVTRIMNEMYSNQPDGLCGNEDCGQMSAWYVFSAMGFYPVTPGSNQYIIGRPFLDSVIISLDKNKKFSIKANNLSKQNIYIASVKLNGKTWDKSYISHKDIISGGEMVIEMTNKPTTWATAAGNRPMTKSIENNVIPAPYINFSSRAFREKADIEMASACKNCKIYYTTDDTEPDTGSTLFTKAFTIKQDIIIKAIAVDSTGRKSPVNRSALNCVPKERSVKIMSEYSPQYSAGGDFALIDRVRGGINFRTGTWQGYQGSDLTAIVDLGKSTSLKKVGAGFIQDVSPWILFPEEVKFFLSNDGKNFTEVALIKNTTPKDQWGSIIKDFAQDIKPQKARYIKLFAKYPGVLPYWHPGAGGASHMFIDEIFFE